MAHPSFSSATYTTVSSPLGPLTVAAHQNTLLGIWFDDQRHQPERQDWQHAPSEPLLSKATAQLKEYFDNDRLRFDLPLSLACGTAFQQQVWQQLLTIEPGTTISYSGLAHQLGKPHATRAVANAIGRNPLCIVVPCHRVVGANGQLTGYAAGLERKAALLHHESARTMTRQAA